MCIYSLKWLEKHQILDDLRVQQLITYSMLYLVLWYNTPMDTMLQQEKFLVVIEHLKIVPLRDTVDLLNDAKHLFVSKFVYTISFDLFHYCLMIVLRLDSKKKYIQEMIFFQILLPVILIEETFFFSNFVSNW